MRCIAIDDEPLALAIIEQYCSRRGGITLETYSDPLRGVERIEQSLPDLVFLDIEMGTSNGVEIARALPKGVRVIFTTAYAQFAIDGFDLNAVDFLHKPFSYTRFERAIEKAEQSLVQSGANEQITVKAEYQNININLDSIVYIESMDNYVRLHMLNQKPLLSQMSLKSIEEMLPAERFSRVHKSFIVARSFIASYSRSVVTLKIGSQIPIGRTYQGDFQTWIASM